MDSNIELIPLPIIFILTIYALFLMDTNIIIGILSVIFLAIAVAIYFLIYRGSKLERERPVIEEIIDNFITPTLDKLCLDRISSGNFDFPDSLNFSFGVSTRNDAFNRFSRRKRLLTWRISRYNRFCRRINSRIRSLAGLSRTSNIIENVVNANGVQIVLTREYSDFSREQLNEVLEQNNLIPIIREIEELQRRLPTKIDRLSTKLNNLIRRWREIYNIV